VPGVPCDRGSNKGPRRALPRAQWHHVRRLVGGLGRELSDLDVELPVVPSHEAEGLGVHDGIFVIFQKTA
jgi:hypothetical protein